SRAPYGQIPPAAVPENTSARRIGECGSWLARTFTQFEPAVELRIDLKLRYAERLELLHVASRSSEDDRREVLPAFSRHRRRIVIMLQVDARNDLDVAFLRPAHGVCRQRALIKENVVPRDFRIRLHRGLERTKFSSHERLADEVLQGVRGTDDVTTLQHVVASQDLLELLTKIRAMRVLRVQHEPQTCVAGGRDDLLETPDRLVRGLRPKFTQLRPRQVFHFAGIAEIETQVRIVLHHQHAVLALADVDLEAPVAARERSLEG